MTHVALLGGSFNPPHLAHQMLCLWALSTRFDQVWMMPTYVHPLGKPLISFQHRARMCELAIEPFSSERVAVCTIEAENERPSRTVDTVEALRERHPRHAFSLLVGADILTQKDDWYRFDRLEQLVEIVAVGRGSHAVPGTVALPDVSSSQIRSALEAGEDVSSVVPASVRKYIAQHQLYRGEGSK